jgi:hypothetical protein
MKPSSTTPEGEGFPRDCVEAHLCRLRQCSDHTDRELYRVLQWLADCHFAPSTPASESAPPTFTLSSIEAASCIYEDCRARGQSAEDAMRKSVGRLIPSSATSETEATILPGPHEPMAQWVKEELKDGDRICEAAGVQRTEGGRLPVAKIVNKLRSTDQSATPAMCPGWHGDEKENFCQYCGGEIARSDREAKDG